MEQRTGLVAYLRGIKNKKPLIALLIIGILGVLLLLFGGIGGEEKGEDYTSQAEAYRRALEEELASLCKQVRGVGAVRVYVTLEKGEEYVWATDETQSGGIDYVMQSGKGLLLYRKTPTVAGVVAVCDGGADEGVVNALSRLFHASLGLPYSRICISPSG